MMQYTSASLLLLLCVCGVCEGLVLKGVMELNLTSGEERVVVELPQPIVVSTAVQENCRQLVNSQQQYFDNVALVYYNLSYTHFLTDTQIKLLPETNRSQILFMDVRKNHEEDNTLYAIEVMQKAKALGFNGVIVRDVGDFTMSSYQALRVWKTKECIIPRFYTYFPDSEEQKLVSIFASSTSSSGTRLQFAVAHVTFDAVNSEVLFVRTPGYVLFVAMPAYFIATWMAFASMYKLYRNGFPQQINSASWLCIGAFALSVVMCKS
ncbi:MAG: hypothetical protein J0L53_03665 [Spirochaetes bacterium]|nr:hypothetical protein [Spirochaetota bacterium]